MAGEFIVEKFSVFVYLKIERPALYSLTSL